MQRTIGIRPRTIWAMIGALILVALISGVAYASSTTTLNAGSCTGEGSSIVATYPYISNGATTAYDADCGSYELGSSGLDTGFNHIQCQNNTWYYDAPAGHACLYVGYSMSQVTSAHNACMVSPPYTCSGLKITSDY
jgi:hypothetical protein